MYKAEFYFIINGDWQLDGNEDLDRLPEKDNTIYFEEKAYRVIDIKKNDEAGYDIYLD